MTLDMREMLMLVVHCDLQILSPLQVSVDVPGHGIVTLTDLPR